MKKFNAGSAEFGLFDFAASAPQADIAHACADPALPIRHGAARNRLRPSRRRLYRQLGKRTLDIVLVLASLPFSLPAILLGALALWLEGGAPFYRQERLGRGGRRFSIVKLRTMVRDADAVLESYLADDPDMRQEWNTLQKIKKDPRITPVGQFLRASSLDELPQLWNVLVGDMSLVGPRPMMPQQAPMYGKMRAYAALRPGITGLWQVSARNGNAFTFRNQVDAAYERSLNLGTDLKILVRTVGVVLRSTGY